ncbi:hypothetical protein [Streptosporangium sp. KLBMP 9127]|nr:hypothetical protein [Streptosporangium sp. KLBMP 9127]
MDPTRSISEQEMLPETRITAGFVPAAAVTNAEALVTVVAEALPPPVVPPPCVAQPVGPASSRAALWAGAAYAVGVIAVARIAVATAPPNTVFQRT